MFLYLEEFEHSIQITIFVAHMSTSNAAEEEWYKVENEMDGGGANANRDGGGREGDAEEKNGIVGGWDALDIAPELLRGVYSYGFEAPSPIQQKTFLPFSQGRNLIAQAQSGTGKTGAFVLGALSRILAWRDCNRGDLSKLGADVGESESAPTLTPTTVLLLAPTRELATQIAEVAQHFAEHIPDVSVIQMIGGMQMGRQYVQTIQQSQYSFVVGTPGRVADMIRRRKWRGDRVGLFILDEADEMVAIKFADQLQYIMETLPETTQYAFFSATFSAELMEVSKQCMTDPVHISVKREQLTLEGIKQYFVALPNERCKLDTLMDVYASLNVTQSIVYCNNVSRVQWLHNMLSKNGFATDCIHSNMERGERENVIARFRKGESRILISSDVTARGIDVQQVGVVVNYDLPRDISGYLHRIGRSGRWGRKGMAINFVMRSDVPKMRDIESFYCTQIDELPASFANDVPATTTSSATA